MKIYARTIQMLKRVELIILVFIEASVGRNMECKHDLNRKITCEFTPDHPTNCSDYWIIKVDPNQPELKSDCNFSNVDGKCHCAIVDDYFYGERFTVILRRNGQISDNFTIITAKHIKPQTPTIISVSQISEGKQNVTWVTHYKDTFREVLTTELAYMPKQSNSWTPAEEKAIHRTYYVLNDLELNTEYIVKARVYVESYNVFSDWSEEFEFVNGMSVESVAKKAVPVVCLILVLIVCTLTCCYVKIKNNWRSKDSFTPKIDAIDNLIRTEYKALCPEKTLASRMMVFLPPEHIREKEQRKITMSVSGCSGNSGQTEISNSTSVDSGLIYHVEKDQNRVLQVRQIQSASKSSVLPDLSDYERVDTQEPKNVYSAPRTNSGCTSFSSFDSQCYFACTNTSPCKYSFFAPSLTSDFGYQSVENCDQPVKGAIAILPPLVQTELAYRPCDGCLNSKAGCPAQSENMEANRTFVSQPKGQKVSEDLVGPCTLCLGQWGPLVRDDEYRPIQSLFPS